MRRNLQAGFTLLEILIALFIFTILSVMMAGGLRTVIDAQSGSERSAERLRELQLVLVRLSRDVEQTVNRPVKMRDGHDTPAFYGTGRGFAFTHGGMAGQSQQHQVLQRAEYIWTGQTLWRMVWSVLDQAANSPKPNQRKVLEEVVNAKFEYLDDKQKFHGSWPAAGMANQPLPRAIKMTLTFANWGTIRQIYVIPAEVIKVVPRPSKS